MWKWFIQKRITAFERKLGYDMTYARELLDADLGAFMTFAKATKLGQYRRDVPRDVYWATKLVGTVSEDCGPCTQLLVTMALAEGVPAAVLSAVLAGDVAAMPEAVALGVRFARASLAHDGAADAAREEVVRRWGPRALISLAFALTVARLYPTLKYALGHGKACQRIVVAGTPVTVHAA
jgi:hypothetical protein